MSTRKHDTSTTAELKARKLKLAEGGIVFVAVLSLCVYLGIRFADDPTVDPTPVAAAVVEADMPPTVATTSGGTEPARVVEPEISTATGEVPPIEVILPEVPLVVTYSNAELAFYEGQYTLAAERFDTYCRQHPENAWGHYMLGLSLWKSGDDAAARGALEEALRVKPDHVKSLVNLARVELELAEPEAALTLIQRAIDLAPENNDARRVLGRIYHNLDRCDDSTGAYLEVLHRQADDAWTLNNLALIWIEQEQFERALSPLARAVELAPEAAVIRNNLATALERTGHLGQACEQYALAGQFGSDHGEASFFRLDAVTVAADDPTVDLTTVAAAWTVPGGETGALATSAVAAVTLEETED